MGNYKRQESVEILVNSLDVFVFMSLLFKQWNLESEEWGLLMSSQFKHKNDRVGMNSRFLFSRLEV